MSPVATGLLDGSLPVQPFHRLQSLLAPRQPAQWAQRQRTEAACVESGSVRASCNAFRPLRTVAPMVKTAAIVPEEQHFILSSLSPSRAQRWLALAAVLALLVVLFITEGPLSTTQAARIDAPSSQLMPRRCS
jgi:hypothetical protein